MSEEFQDPRLSALETALGALTPATNLLNRDQIFFRAGQAAAHRRLRAWSGTAGVLAVVTVVLGTALLLRPMPTMTERIVYLPAPAPTEPSPSPAPDTSVTLARDEDEPLTLQQQLARWGLDGLPNPAPQAAPDPLPDAELPRDVPAAPRSSAWFGLDRLFP